MFESGPPAQVVCGKDKHTKNGAFLCQAKFHSFIWAQMGAGLKTKTSWSPKKALFVAMFRLLFGNSSENLFSVLKPGCGDCRLGVVVTVCVFG